MKLRDILQEAKPKDAVVKVVSTSRATFTSSESESTIHRLINGGWEFEPQDLQQLYSGKTVVLYADNRKIAVTIKK